MKKTFWIILFLIVLAADIIMIILEEEMFRTITKPLLMPVLILGFIIRTPSIRSSLKKWVTLALLFSWFGDVLLIFEPEGEIFFILGLSAFLIAHIFYILYFHFIRLRERIKGNAILFVIVVIYYAILISLLSPFLGDMKIPVRVYGVVISFMFMVALHMLFIRNRQAGFWMAIGAFFFIISDTLLAINKFYIPFETAGELIMLTYGLAQLQIVEGAIDYLNDYRLVNKG